MHAAVFSMSVVQLSRWTVTGNKDLLDEEGTHARCRQITPSSLATGAADILGMDLASNGRSSMAAGKRPG
jgi:hypothetical protein